MFLWLYINLVHEGPQDDQGPGTRRASHEAEGVGPRDFPWKQTMGVCIPPSPIFTPSLSFSHTHSLSLPPLSIHSYPCSCRSTGAPVASSPTTWRNPQTHSTRNVVTPSSRYSKTTKNRMCFTPTTSTRYEWRSYSYHPAAYVCFCSWTNKERQRREECLSLTSTCSSCTPRPSKLDARLSPSSPSPASGLIPLSSSPSVPPPPLSSLLLTHS